MAKNKQQRALFEVLARERRQQAEAEGQPKPLVRRGDAGPEKDKPTRGSAAAGAPGDRLTGVPLQTPFTHGRVGLSYFAIGLAVLAVVWLCILSYLVGRWTSPRQPGAAPEALPNVEERPTWDDVRGEGVTPDLTGDGNPATAGEDQAGDGWPAGGGEAETEPAGEAPTDDTAPGWRVRIASLEVARSEYIDKLREVLAARGVETEMVPRGGYYILYSQRRVPGTDSPEAKALLRDILAAQQAFEEATGWSARTDPYVVPVR